MDRGVERCMYKWIFDKANTVKYEVWNLGGRYIHCAVL